MNIKLAPDSVFADVSRRFKEKWDPRKGNCPEVDYVFSITNSTLRERWQVYRNSLQNKQVEKHFHGTVLTCNIIRNKYLCTDSKCGICGISRTGFDPSRISTVTFQRFGHGFYLAPNSSKCHDYTEGVSVYRAMLLFEVCTGNKFKRTRQDTKLRAPPQGYDSVYGMTGGELNYEEIILFNPDATLPKFIILYQKDGIQKLI